MENEPDGWVRADWYAHHNLKQFFVSARWLWDIGGMENDVHYFRNPGFPSRVAEILKEKGKVPADAYMIGYFYHRDRHGFTVRFAHSSFEEIKVGSVVPEEIVG